jgi:hypothetical protein
MDNKHKWLLYLIGVFLIAGACNLFTNPLNKVDDLISEVDDLANQVPIDEIQDDLEALVTNLPAEIETLATDLPDEIDDIGDLGDIGDIITGGFGSGEVPPDIPVVEPPRDDLIGSNDIVSYMTPMDFDSVLTFYQEEMPMNDWVPLNEENVITDDAAVLYFEKPGREAIVTLSVNPLDDNTVVMITIQTKE